MSLNSLLPKSLANRLVVLNVAAFYLLLGLAFLILYGSIGAVLQSRADNEFKEDVAEFAQILSDFGLDGVKEEMDKETLVEFDSSFLLLFDSSGAKVHATPMDYFQNYVPLVSVNESGLDDTKIVKFDNQYFELSDVSARIAHAPLSTEFQLIMGESTEERDEIMGLLALAFVSVFLFTLPTASMLVWGITRRAVMGIQSVQSAALDLKQGALSRRVRSEKQVEEVQTLADTFDAMADRIQRLVVEIQEMTENISHDLRTPIGRIRLLVESMAADTNKDTETERKSLQAISECDRLITMIDTSLDVSETEAGVVHSLPVDINMVELLRDACELFEALAEEKRIGISRNFLNVCIVSGQLNSVQRMIANLLDNAVKYTSYGGSIDVAMSKAEGILSIEISNTGFVIDENNYENIFNRFYRVDSSRSSDGCGLGLSYSRAVARAMGGDITVVSNQVSRNTFTLTMPFHELSANAQSTMIAV